MEAIEMGGPAGGCPIVGRRAGLASIGRAFGSEWKSWGTEPEGLSAEG